MIHVHTIPEGEVAHHLAEPTCPCEPHVHDVPDLHGRQGRVETEARRVFVHQSAFTMAKLVWGIRATCRRAS